MDKENDIVKIDSSDYYPYKGYLKDDYYEPASYKYIYENLRWLSKIAGKEYAIQKTSSGKLIASDVYVICVWLPRKNKTWSTSKADGLYNILEVMSDGFWIPEVVTKKQIILKKTTGFILGNSNKRIDLEDIFNSYSHESLENIPDDKVRVHAVFSPKILAKVLDNDYFTYCKVVLVSKFAAYLKPGNYDNGSDDYEAMLMLMNLERGLNDGLGIVGVTEELFCW